MVAAAAIARLLRNDSQIIHVKILLSYSKTEHYLALSFSSLWFKLSQNYLFKMMMRCLSLDLFRCCDCDDDELVGYLLDGVVPWDHFHVGCNPQVFRILKSQAVNGQKVRSDKFLSSYYDIADCKP